ISCHCGVGLFVISSGCSFLQNYPPIAYHSASSISVPNVRARLHHPVLSPLLVRHDPLVSFSPSIQRRATGTPASCRCRKIIGVLLNSASSARLPCKTGNTARLDEDRPYGQREIQQVRAITETSW